MCSATLTPVSVAGAAIDHPTGDAQRVLGSGRERGEGVDQDADVGCGRGHLTRRQCVGPATAGVAVDEQDEQPHQEGDRQPYDP